jgi:hypothetical protein
MAIDPQRFKEAYERLENLDDRLSHKLRPRPAGGLMRGTPEQHEEQLRDLATYTLELKEIVKELFLAIAGKKAD